MRVDPREHPMSIQIFGGTEETLLQAAQYVDQHTAADIIDINMGCPVPKVTKTDSGSKWLLDANKIYQMVHAVVQNVQKPVTVKMRIGWDRKHIFAVENALAAQEAGASMVACMAEPVNKCIKVMLIGRHCTMLPKHLIFLL